VAKKRKQRTAPAVPSEKGDRRWVTVIPSLLICVAVFCVYSNTFTAPFILDDINAITDNPHIRSIFPLGRSMSAPDQSTVAGRPVVALSLAFNYAVSGLNPWSYHLFNIIAHCLSAILLLHICRRIFSVSGRVGVARAVRSNLFAGKDSASGLPHENTAAVAVAMIWALHPLHTEVVTYVSTRTEGLMSLFFLAAFYCLIRYAGTPPPDSASGIPVWPILCFVSVALAMGSKENAVALPLLLFLFDRIFLSNSWRTVLARRGRLHAAVAATWLIPFYLITQGPRSATVGIHFAHITPLDYLRTQAGIVVHYLRLSVLPHPLVLDYHNWPIAYRFTPAISALLTIFIVLCTMSVVFALKNSKTAFWGVWFFAILAPSSSVVPIATEIAAERRMYLPLVAVIILLVTGVTQLSKIISPKTVTGSPESGKSRENPGFTNPVRRFGLSAATLFTVIVCIPLAWLTYQRNQDYSDDISIWQDTVQKRPLNSRAHANLGAAYLGAGRFDDAVPYLEQALRLDPAVQGLIDSDISDISSSIVPDMSSYRALENLALVYMERGNTAKAVRFLEFVALNNPDDALTFFNLGNAAMRAGQANRAETAFHTAVTLAPENALFHIRYARVLFETGRTDNARAHARQALVLDPNHPEVRQMSGVILDGKR
jgi:protein O-mannosyl-transferase